MKLIVAFLLFILSLMIISSIFINKKNNDCVRKGGKLVRVYGANYICADIKEIK